MLIPGSTETETRSQLAHTTHLLQPLHVLLSTQADPTPRDVAATSVVDTFARSSTPVWITAEPGAGGVWLAQAMFDRTQDGGAFVRQECEEGIAPVISDGRGVVFLSRPERLTREHQEILAQYLKRSDMQHLEGLRMVPPAPRVIAWSPRSVQDLVQAGQLLPVLGQWFGRLEVAIPPLRNQPEPIGAFADAVLNQVSAHEGIAKRRLTPEAIAVLGRHAWPGNLEELHTILERACLLADPSHAILDVTDLPTQLTSAPSGAPAATPPAPQPVQPRTHVPRTMQEIEAEAIRNAIEYNNGNLVRAARELRIGRATLYRKLKKYNIPTRSERRKQLMK